MADCAVDNMPQFQVITKYGYAFSQVKKCKTLTLHKPVAFTHAELSTCQALCAVTHQSEELEMQKIYVFSEVYIFGCGI